MNKKIKGCLIAIIGIPLIGGALVSIVFHTGEPSIEKHLDSVDWLPHSASDVSYFERKGFGWVKIYECSMPEESFLAFASCVILPKVSTKSCRKYPLIPA
jgi:hypothetical protein